MYYLDTWGDSIRDVPKINIFDENKLKFKGFKSKL